MSKVDDELTRRLHRAERPLDVDELFESVERRRTHRRRVRRVQAGALAVVVLLSTAAGFVVLRSAFQPPPGGSATDPNGLTPIGLIVFSRIGEDGYYHLYVAQPDGSELRQLTHEATDDSNPAVSPDGRWITLVRTTSDPYPDVVTVPFDDPDVEPVEPRFSAIVSPEPAWSADGSRLAFREGGETTGTILLIAPDVGDGYAAYFSAPGGDLAHPSWSPGSQLVFSTIGSADQGDTGWDLATVSDNGTGFRWLLKESGDQRAPSWSPDGSRIAFLRAEEGGHQIWTIAPDGTDEGLIASVEASLEPDLTWAPDGSALLVSDGEWIYRVDAKPQGDPRDNFVRVMRGVSPSWFLPAGAEPIPSASPEPNPSPSPTRASEPAGRDIGIGVRMCDVQVLDNINWDGTGIDGAAWTGAPVDEDGRCSSSANVQHVVAVDRDGDGIAEQGSTSTLRSCLLCRPFDTMDLNDDGVLELVVLEEASSTPTYSLYEVNRPGSERALGVYPIFVVPPGAPAMNLDPNEPTRFMVGGDEGFSGSIACENDGPGPPILRYTWVRGAVDTDTELRVDVTRLSFGEDGVFHIESVDRFSVPRNPEPTDLKSTEPACGVDFHPAA